jgi:hypothetical protein
MALEDTMKNTMLAEVDTVVSHISLHSAFPATLGNEIDGGAPAYARQAVAWDAPASGSIAMTGTEVFDIEGGDTVGSCGLADAASSGAIQGGADLTDETYGGQGTYTLTALSVSIT